MKRILWSLSLGLFMLFSGWYAGINYFERGAGAAYFLCMAVALSIICYLCPVWPTNPKSKG